MPEQHKTNRDALVTKSRSDQQGSGSHLDQWERIQQSGKIESPVSPPKKIHHSGSNEWGCILAVVGLILFLVLLFASHDTSYRDKMTPDEKHIDDLRNEQEAYENELHR